MGRARRADGDEDFTDTLRREFAEEVPGVNVIGLQQLMGAARLHKDIRDDTSLVLVYFLVGGVVPKEIQLGDEHQTYKWISDRDDIPTEDLKQSIRDILIQLLEEK